MVKNMAKLKYMGIIKTYFALMQKFETGKIRKCLLTLRKLEVFSVSHLGFFWLLVFRGVCGCACALVCMQFLCFLGYL